MSNSRSIYESVYLRAEGFGRANSTKKCEKTASQVFSTHYENIARQIIAFW